MKQELGGSAQVIATGGLASLLAEETGVFKCVDRTLTLDGLYIIYQQYLRAAARKQKRDCQTTAS